MQIYKSIGAKVFYYRKAAGFSQALLGEKAGLSAEFISRIENGHRAPSVATLSRIADVLGVELLQILDFDGAAPMNEADARANRVAKMVRGANDDVARKIEEMVTTLTS
jgi:transcriptional regulator with XRE-family HTH domain